MKTLRTSSLVALAAVALPIALYGQAMVGYGINVGRAGAAGTVSGAGLGGILSKVKGTTDQSGDTSGSYRRTQPDFSDEDVQSKPTVIRLETKDENAATATSGSRKMKGGVTISGLPASSGSSSGQAEVQVREVTPPVRDGAYTGIGSGSSSSGAYSGAGSAAPAGRPAAAKTAVAEPKTSPETSRSETEESSSASAPETTAGLSAVASSDTVAPTPGVLAPLAAGSQPATKPRPQAAGGAVERAPVGITVGEEIQQVIERLGKPTMVLKGIAGEDFTEKYTFRTKDGRRITVLALHGKVTAVTTGNEPLSAQAALR